MLIFSGTCGPRVTQVHFYKSRVNIRMHAALASLVLHRTIHRWGAGEEAPGTSSTAKSAGLHVRSGGSAYRVRCFPASGAAQSGFQPFPH